jgi:hypothetical protein
MQNWAFGIHNDVGHGTHLRRRLEQRLGMLRQAQMPGATKIMSEALEERMILDSLGHVKHSLKKLEIHCP